ncbi:hypothetical protein Hokovirus_5_16 [Hokovirus HKV1]|uniref:Uncharacterized protein n=1 Tax=Hokovirus HKV1 TaxID=1977638 RepID=A0A1V0SHL5_9VIRU|nr:hypothetical protein Hokovirus_5_16 [Hokovirus HKV1]
MSGSNNINIKMSGEVDIILAQLERTSGPRKRCSKCYLYILVSDFAEHSSTCANTRMIPKLKSSEDARQFCDNCSRYIPASDFPNHSSTCGIPCKFSGCSKLTRDGRCDEHKCKYFACFSGVSKNSYCDRCMTPSKCPTCDDTIMRWSFHICRNMKAFCGAIIPRDGAKLHNSQCRSCSYHDKYGSSHICNCNLQGCPSCCT